MSINNRGGVGFKIMHIQGHACYKTLQAFSPSCTQPEIEMEMEMGVGGCMSLDLQYDQKKAFFFKLYPNAKP